MHATRWWVNALTSIVSTCPRLLQHITLEFRAPFAGIILGLDERHSSSSVQLDTLLIQFAASSALTKLHIEIYCRLDSGDTPQVLEGKIQRLFPRLSERGMLEVRQRSPGQSFCLSSIGITAHCYLSSDVDDFREPFGVRS